MNTNAMSMKRSEFISLALGFAIISTSISSCRKENFIEADAGSMMDVPYITVSFDSDNLSKTSYSMEGNKLKTYWAEGDIVSVVPDLGLYVQAGTYKVINPGSSTGVFQQVKAVGQAAQAYGYAIIYPGDRIKSLPQFTKFSYEGQVQSKADPMGHNGKFHTMWVKASDYSEISMAGADQSSCMRLTLKGMAFVNPVKIEVAVSGSARRFYANNYVNESYYYYTNDAPAELQYTPSLSLELSGYGTENCIEAWIVMPNASVRLNPGDNLTVSVYQENGSRYIAAVPIKKTMQLKGGKWHNLTVNGGWGIGEGDFEKYEWDGDVVNLQTGKDGLNIVFMGDGFIKEDFDNGTYDNIMRKAYEQFFNIEPYRTLKDDFTASYIKVVSPERILAQNTGLNGAANTGHITRLSTEFTPNSTSVSGNDDLAIEYAMNALGSNANEKIKDATIVVIANQACRAGTCYNKWYSNNGRDYGQACAVAYCALGRNSDEFTELIHHEVGGHAFGKLADEYYDDSSITSTQPWIDMDAYHRLGLFRNTDKFVNRNFYNQLGGRYPLTTKSNVYWSDMFGTANNYESPSVESLGVFEGGNTYGYGFCRPTENPDKSIMNGNRDKFNAVGRRQIYYRYLSLSGEVGTNQYGSSTELTRFLSWDAGSIMPKIFSGEVKNRYGRSGRYIEEAPAPFAAPVLCEGYWENGKFIPAASSAPSRREE